LHGASNGERSYLLYEHVAQLLAPQGIAVIRYDRRSAVAGGDVPLIEQAQDALAAAETLRHRAGDVPVALWGYSQGAWAAVLAANRRSAAVAALVLVSMSAVGPAVQMRYGTAEQLRRHGFDAAAVAALGELRGAYESYLRGDTDRQVADTVVRRFADEPWFPLAWVPTDLPPAGIWTDMDFDPAPLIDALAQPVLAFYGDTDEWVPLDPSLAAWDRLRRHHHDVTVVRLPGCDHAPLVGGVEAIDHVSNDYVAALTEWCTRIFRF
jgi:pimeloyl-ACP methyl ester carboxylesterase